MRFTLTSFLSLAFLSSTWLAGLVDAAGDNKRTIINRNLIEQRIRQGKLDSKKLMQKARPFHSDGKKSSSVTSANKIQLRRALNEEFEITAGYDIKFNSCLSLTLEDDELLEDEWVSYTKAGTLVSQRSFVLFDICLSDECYYEEDNDMATYIVDVNTFIEALVAYLPYKESSFCQSCVNNADYCNDNYDNANNDNNNNNNANDDGNGDNDDDANANDNQEGDNDNDNNDDQAQNDNADEQQNDDQAQNDNDQGNNNNEDGGRRFLDENNQYIDCDQCYEEQCFNNQDDDGSSYYDDAIEWIEEIAQCQDLDYEWNDLDLYAGFICNSDGDGVEVGVFVNDDCTVYTSKNNYAKLLKNQGYNYDYTIPQEIIQHMFTSTISCDADSLLYSNAYDQNDDDDDGNGGNNDYGEAAEWCQDLFDGDLDTLSLYDCANYQDDGDNNGDEEDNKYEDYNWYSYDLSEEDGDNAYKICNVIRKLDGEYTTFYDSKKSGTVFDYSNSDNTSRKSGSRLFKNFGVPQVVIFVIVIIAAIGVVLAIFNLDTRKVDNWSKYRTRRYGDDDDSSYWSMASSRY